MGSAPALARVRRCRARPRRTASTLRVSVASSTPVPRPVTSAASAPVKAAISAADAVVLAMPMSPVRSTSAPSSIRASATSTPTSSAASASSRVIAGPAARSAVPLRTRRRRRAARRRGRRPGGCDAHVDDHDAGTGLRRQCVDGGAAGDEVRHHLGRDLLRPRGHALRVDAVVGGEDRDSGARRDRRRAAPGDSGEADRDVLEGAERTAGLGQAVLPRAGLGRRGRVGRTEFREGASQSRWDRVGHPPTLRSGLR